MLQVCFRPKPNWRDSLIRSITHWPEEARDTSGSGKMSTTQKIISRTWCWRSNHSDACRRHNLMACNQRW